eukprot:jgi/Chlat1/4540/Chrsp29S04450
MAAVAAPCSFALGLSLRVSLRPPACFPRRPQAEGSTRRQKNAVIVAAGASSARPSRREVGVGLSLGLGLLCGLVGDAKDAHAGLLQFPPDRLKNDYVLVRSGACLADEYGRIETNPVLKTSVTSGLTEAGRRQVYRTLRTIEEMGVCDSGCWIWPSIWQRSYQTAELLAAGLGIGRSRIVPEYSFLDARGLGAFEGKSIEEVFEIYGQDALSERWRPPPNTDGTPNESVADVFVRVAQLMSILETQYSGSTVIIVAPDSDNLSVLQAALEGRDLRQHSDLAFALGEARLVQLSQRDEPIKPLYGKFTCANPPSCL